MKIKTKILKSLSTPAIEDEDDVDSNNTSFYTKSIEDDENSNTGSIDSEISDKISALLNYENTHAKNKFKKQDLNIYHIYSNLFQIFDDKLKFNENQYKVSPYFFKTFLTGNKVDLTQFNEDEKEALIDFVDYAGGLAGDKRSNL